jgi:hypothetical protein
MGTETSFHTSAVHARAGTQTAHTRTCAQTLLLPRVVSNWIEIGRSRAQSAESREQRADSRERRADSREQIAENGEQIAESREQTWPARVLGGTGTSRIRWTLHRRVMGSVAPFASRVRLRLHRHVMGSVAPIASSVRWRLLRHVMGSVAPLASPVRLRVIRVCASARWHRDQSE